MPPTDGANPAPPTESAPSTTPPCSASPPSPTRNDTTAATTTSTGGSSSSSNLGPSPPYRNNPNLTAPVTVTVAPSASASASSPTGDTSARDEQITNAVRLIRPDLFGCHHHHQPSSPSSACSGAPLGVVREVTIRQLGGGLSNHLFVVKPFVVVHERHPEEEEEEEAILVRVHAEDDGDGDDADDADGCCSFVDRNTENQILAHLSALGLAPTFHGLFRNGRVEQFYDGYRPLGWDEMGEARFARPIGREMARLHRLDVPDGVVVVGKEGREVGEIWGKVDGWIRMAERVSSAASASAAAATEEEGGGGEDVTGTMAVEWEWLKGELRGLPPPTPSSPALSPDDGGDEKEELDVVRDDVPSMAVSFFRQVVFCHMDCQSLNILTPCGSECDGDAGPSSGGNGGKGEEAQEEEEEEEEEGEATVRLIDFEYAGLNPRAVDVANTFCEHCDMNNLSPKYEEQYPTPRQQDVYLRAYVSEVDPTLAERLDRIGEGGGGWEAFLSAARTEVGKHTLVSHLGWAVWAVAQSGTSTIEFDYLKYADLRMEGYRYFKGEYWPPRRAC